MLLVHIFQTIFQCVLKYIFKDSSPKLQSSLHCWQEKVSINFKCIESGHQEEVTVWTTWSFYSSEGLNTYMYVHTYIKELSFSLPAPP